MNNKYPLIKLQTPGKMKAMDKFFRKLEKELINALKIKGDYLTLDDLKSNYEKSRTK